jgi:hypothetical protein
MDIKDRYSKIFLQSANLIADDNSIKKYRAEWWWNVRSKNHGGLRLTERALKFIQSSAEIKTYRIEFPAEFSFTPQVFLWLDQFIESPFYINKKYIIVLKEKSAFELYLLSGDVRKLGHNKALAKKFNQELTLL